MMVKGVLLWKLQGERGARDSSVLGALGGRQGTRSMFLSSESGLNRGEG